MPQPPDGFLFYLTDTLPGQTEFFADFLQCHFLGIDSEKQLNDIPLSLRKGRQSTFHFRGKGFIDQGTVGNGRIVIHQDIEQRPAVSSSSLMPCGGSVSLFCRRWQNNRVLCVCR